MPPAPALLSMMTGCFQASDSFLPSARAKTSFEPPGGNGTTIVTGFVGYCADADAAARKSVAIQSREILRIVPPIGKPILA